MAEEKTVLQEEKWDIEIKPKDKLLAIDFKELWQYRDLCSLFVKRNIITQYKQTILGPTWYIVQPALTVIMYMIVVSPEFRPMAYRVLCFILQEHVFGSISLTALQRHPIPLLRTQVFLAKSIFLVS